MNPAELMGGGGGGGNISPSQIRAVSTSTAGKTLPSLTAASTTTGLGQYPRINLEPIYAQLKGALGDNWNDYKAALSAFFLGQLNQAELTWVLQPFLSSTTPPAASADSGKVPLSTLHLHNTLLVSIYENTRRDDPPTQVAPWVVATDKPTSTAKNAGAGSGANDKADERLRREVMTLHARDRKRIKALKESGKPVNNGYAEMQAYANELAVKSATQDGDPQSATATGSLARSNYDIEIRRRFAQTLACEAMEFPSHSDIQNRIEPICYEEGLTGGVAQGALPACTEILEQSVEVYVKEMLGSLLSHARSNGAGGEGVQTNKFRRRLRKEEDDAERGVLQRNAAGLLPAEMEMQATRQPLDLHDMRLSMGLFDQYLRTDRFLDESIMLNQYPELDLGPKTNGFSNGVSKPATNGVAIADPDAMDMDGAEYGMFKGVGKADFDAVLGALDDCLQTASG